MRIILVLGVLAASLTTTSLITQARGVTCPASPRAASSDVWKRRDLKLDRPTTGTHACGRQLQCTGGSVDKEIKRKCQWL